MAWFVGQSLLFVALAFVLGLVVGWLIWGRTTRPVAGEAGSRAEKPQPAAVEADMDVVAEPVDAEPDAAEPEPATAEPEPVAAEADVAAEPEPVAAEADPVVAEPEPVAAEAGSDLVAEPVVTEPQPEPVLVTPSEPEPAPEPAPVAVTPDPTPESVAAVAPVPAVAPVVEAEPLAKPDNLQRIEGIGPKISKVLVSAGIRTYEQLAASDDATLSAILRQGGLRFAPSLPTWGVQAALLAKGDETGFTELTGELVASRRSR